MSVETAIEDADGKVVAASTAPSDSDRARPLKSSSRSASLRIRHPRLWQGIKDPYLYRTVVDLALAQGRGRSIASPSRWVCAPSHSILTRASFSTVSTCYLHGASMHQDRPVKGWAISRADQEQDFDILADMGANAVRLAHYQHDQRSYELADERGIIAWAEIPLVNNVSFDGTPASEAFAANARQQLARAHPAELQSSLDRRVVDRQRNRSDARRRSRGPSQPASLLKSLNVSPRARIPPVPRPWPTAARWDCRLTRAATLPTSRPATPSSVLRTSWATTATSAGIPANSATSA